MTPATPLAPIENVAFTPVVATPGLLEARKYFVYTLTESDGEITGSKSYDPNRKWSATTPDAIRIGFYDEKGFYGDVSRLYVLDVSPVTSGYPCLTTFGAIQDRQIPDDKFLNTSQEPTSSTFSTSARATRPRRSRTSARPTQPWRPRRAYPRSRRPSCARSS